MDAIGRQYPGRISGKRPALETGIIADCNGLRSALRLHPVCHALRCLADHPDIHPVCAGSECSAQSGSAELQGCSEPIFDCIIISADLTKLV